jgi:5'-methylthioadenosine phosphorylase
MASAFIGILGGSGLYQMKGLEDVQEMTIDTPYGSPSDLIVTGRLADVPVAFLARHGRGHRLLPSEVPYRANIHALKQLGVRYLVSVSAVGSLCEAMRPLDVVLPDQFIDFTRRRDSTFFGEGAVAHVSMAQPVCPALADLLAKAARNLVVGTGRTLHEQATYVCIEGPQFSSQAESRMYQQLGAHLIGMTNMPEAKLAREAEIAYATMAMVTDYDCWHPRETHVSADQAIANLMQNAELGQRILAAVIPLIARESPRSIAHTALDSALVTRPEDIAEPVQQRLRAILGGRV